MDWKVEIYNKLLTLINPQMKDGRDMVEGCLIYLFVNPTIILS